MNNDALAAKIATIVSSTSHELITSLLPKLDGWDSGNWSLSVAKALANIHNSNVRSDLLELFDIWQRDFPDIPGSAIALSLRSALLSYANQVQFDLVWTGPATQAIPVRRTEQALLQLIDASQEKLLIVSFSVYKIRQICEAIEAAITRGVQVELCVESVEESEGILSFSGSNGFSQVIRRAATWYIWPLQARSISDKGDHGALHAKLALADRARLFISSANLTEYAMELNMELGVLINGGILPGKVADHFEELKASNIFVRKYFV